METASDINYGDTCCFVTMFRTPVGERHCRIAIESLKAFGGTWKDAPIIVFLIQPCEVSLPLNGIDNIHFCKLDMPAEIQDFPFSEKVVASSQAEEQLSSRFRSMVWIDTRCLIANPPALFEIDETIDAALRPVHIKNIGSIASSPPDPYWQEIYSVLEATMPTWSVKSFCEESYLRPYFNLHCFSINPTLGLCQSWLEYFQLMVQSKNFQANACQDELHQIFLHQAIFSTLAIRELGPDRIRQLSPPYNYPLHPHPQIPKQPHAEYVNDLVNPVN